MGVRERDRKEESKCEEGLGEERRIRDKSGSKRRAGRKMEEAKARENRMSFLKVL